MAEVDQLRLSPATRLADTVAAELAQQAWLGVDVPFVIRPPGVRRALAHGLPGEVTLEQVLEWSQPALYAIAESGDASTLELRVAATVAAALILGAKLQETNGT